MFTIELPLTIVQHYLDDGIFLEEALLFPEIRCLGSKAPTLHRTVKNLVIRTVLEISPFEVHQRRLPNGAEAGVVSLTLTPAARSHAWQEPVTLRFPVVRWRHPAPQALNSGAAPTAEAALAYVPALDIEEVASRPDLLETQLLDAIRTALLRIKANALQPLVWLQRCREIQLVQLPCAIELKTPKQLAREESELHDQGKPVLPEVGVDLCKEPLQPGYELDSIIERMVETLTGAQPRSVLLIGPSGVGKTSAVHELVRQRVHWRLAATPFWATTGSRLVSGMSGFGMWQERCQTGSRSIASACRSSSGQSARTDGGRQKRTPGSGHRLVFAALPEQGRPVGHRRVYARTTAADRTARASTSGHFCASSRCRAIAQAKSAHPGGICQRRLP